MKKITILLIAITAISCSKKRNAACYTCSTYKESRFAGQTIRSESSETVCDMTESEAAARMKAATIETQSLTISTYCRKLN